MEKICIREVWASNLAAEMSLIEACLEEFPVISMDTEFPGTVFASDDHRRLCPHEFYAMMKLNVDALSLIQLGLTLSDAAGNLPDLDGSRQVWQFNFADFDDSQPHNPESISLLRRQGIDFFKNRCMGIDSRCFADLFLRSGLFGRRNLVWVTFHGAYDFAFLIKILTGGRPLPGHVGRFMELMQRCFGAAVFDLKPVAGAAGLYGGLERIAERLKVERTVGRSHQAGSDSLLTMQVLIQLAQANSSFTLFNYNLFGLTPPLRL